MIIQGYYNNKSVCKKDKVVVKYIPRSIYEEQLKPAESLQTFYKGMFEDILSHYSICFCLFCLFFIFILNISKWIY
jgi:hypothetical protein